jgi:hypothetical protein
MRTEEVPPNGGGGRCMRSGQVPPYLAEKGRRARRAGFVLLLLLLLLLLPLPPPSPPPVPELGWFSNSSHVVKCQFVFVF